MAARRPAATVLLCLLAARVTTAQPSAPLTLAQAEQTALQNHPQVQAAQFTARAATEVVRETRAAYFPTAFGSITGAA